MSLAGMGVVAAAFQARLKEQPPDKNATSSNAPAKVDEAAARFTFKWEIKRIDAKYLLAVVANRAGRANLQRLLRGGFLFRVARLFVEKDM